MSERFLPDKAIDALDEAGSRVHITNSSKTNFRSRTSIRGRTWIENVVKTKIRRGWKNVMMKKKKDLAIAQEQWEEDAKTTE
jgi:ATP-dependent Clp protease ATP-binding subunit ClpC